MTKIRALIKATSWRIIGSTGTVLTAWWLTGELELAAAIGGVEFFLKIGMFYVHERIWEKVLPSRDKSLCSELPLGSADAGSKFSLKELEAS
jgi:uncharacterized membrane protein